MAKKARTGSLYLRGNTYWLKFQVDGQVFRQSLDTSNKSEAESKQKEIMRPLALLNKADALAITKARLQDVEAQIANDAQIANPPLTMSHAWTTYVNATNRPDSSYRTLSGYESIWKRFYRWTEQSRQKITSLCEVDADLAAQYATRLTKDGVTASTFNQHIGFLRLLWKTLDDKICGDVNPWTKIQKRRLQRLEHRRKTITPEQLNALLDATDDQDLRDLVFTLAWTGQRLVDGVYLRWDSIQFSRHIITLYPRKTIRTAKAVYIPLLPQLDVLLQNRRKRIEGDLVFPEILTLYERDNSAVVKKIQKLFERIGLQPRDKRPGISRAVTSYGAHSLRHFFATQALAAAIPAEIVKRITGHNSDVMLEGYEHIDAAMIGDFAKRLSNGGSIDRSTMNELPESTMTANKKAAGSQVQEGELTALAAKISSGGASEPERLRFKELAAQL